MEKSKCFLDRECIGLFWIDLKNILITNEFRKNTDMMEYTETDIFHVALLMEEYLQKGYSSNAHFISNAKESDVYYSSLYTHADSRHYTAAVFLLDTDIIASFYQFTRIFLLSDLYNKDEKQHLSVVQYTLFYDYLHMLLKALEGNMALCA